MRAKQRGTSAARRVYDRLAEGGGEHLIYFPIYNYNGHPRRRAEMLDHPRALVGLGDAGAHVGTVCDASFRPSC